QPNRLPRTGRGIYLPIRTCQGLSTQSSTFPSGHATTSVPGPALASHADDVPRNPPQRVTLLTIPPRSMAMPSLEPQATAPSAATSGDVSPSTLGYMTPPSLPVDKIAAPGSS